MIKIDAILSTIKLISTTFYFFLAAQGAYYVILRYNKAVNLMSPSQFADLRRLTDLAIETPLKVLYLSTVILMAFWLFCSFPSRGSFSYLLFVIALFLILAELILALKISLPLNEIIIKGSNQLKYQLDWIKWITIRGCLSITGMVLLLLDKAWR